MEAGGKSMGRRFGRGARRSEVVEQTINALLGALIAVEQARDALEMYGDDLAEPKEPGTKEELTASLGGRELRSWYYSRSVRLLFGCFEEEPEKKPPPPLQHRKKV